MNYESELWRQVSSKFSTVELAKYRREFDEFDIDRNGSITEDELDAVLKSFGQKVGGADLASMIKEIDADQSGTIEFDEFLQMIYAIQSGQAGGAFHDFYSGLKRIEDKPAAAAERRFSDAEVAECLALDKHAWFAEAEARINDPRGDDHKPLEWSDEFSVNIKKLDLQHQKLFRMLNELERLVDTGGDSVELAAVLDGLLDYTVYHFKSEEELFAEHGFEHERDHGIVHQAFTDKVASVVDAYKQAMVKQEAGEPAESPLTWGVLHFVRAWVIGHIKVEDGQYGAPLNAAGVY